MNLTAAVETRRGRLIQAGANDRFAPVHQGAHMHFMKIGYMHTGNKMRGGICTSEYFKNKGGDTRNVSVQADGTYVKTCNTASGTRRSRGKMDASGITAWREGEPRDKIGEWTRDKKQGGHGGHSMGHHGHSHGAHHERGKHSGRMERKMQRHRQRRSE